MRDNRSPFSNAKRFAPGLEGNCKPAFHVWEFRNRGRTLVDRSDDEQCLCSELWGPERQGGSGCLSCGAVSEQCITHAAGMLQALLSPSVIRWLYDGRSYDRLFSGCDAPFQMLASFGQIGASLATQSLTTFFECSALIVVIVPVQLTAGSNPLFTSDILWSSRLL